MHRTSSTRGLFLSASLVALLTATPGAAWATQASDPQQTQDDDPAAARADDAAVTADEIAPPLETGDGSNEIVVTGSRIARPEFAFPNPVTSFTSESIEQSGETNLTEFLTDTPALQGSLTSEQNAGSNTGF